MIAAVELVFANGESCFAGYVASRIGRTRATSIGWSSRLGRISDKVQSGRRQTQVTVIFSFTVVVWRSRQISRIDPKKLATHLAGIGHWAMYLTMMNRGWVF